MYQRRGRLLSEVDACACPRSVDGIAVSLTGRGTGAGAGNPFTWKEHSQGDILTVFVSGCRDGKGAASVRNVGKYRSRAKLLGRF